MLFGSSLSYLKIYINKKLVIYKKYHLRGRLYKNTHLRRTLSSNKIVIPDKIGDFFIYLRLLIDYKANDSIVIE